MGRRRTADEALHLAHYNLGEAFKLAYREMFGQANIPAAIFDVTENHLIDYESQTLRKREHGELASACVAAVLHLRQQHLATGVVLSPEVILFMGRAFRYVRIAEEYLHGTEGVVGIGPNSRLGKTIAKDWGLMQKIMPNWRETAKNVVQGIKKLKTVQTVVDRLRDPTTIQAELDAYTALDALTEYFPRKLTKQTLTDLAAQMLTLSGQASGVKPPARAQYFTAYEALLEIARIHNILDAPLDPEITGWDPAKLFLARQPTAAVVATQLRPRIHQ